jgi:hypothetical protein
VKTSIQAIEELIGQDPAGRNVAPLILPGELERAARELLDARKALIASGFFVPSAGAGETDGPPGAKAIGEALRGLGCEAAYVTDAPNAVLFERIGALPLHLYTPGLLERERPSHLVAVERLGRAEDGRYYNMRGEDVSAHTEPVDQLFLDAAQTGIPTVGIGDGGNEIGMGRVAAAVGRHVDNGAQIASVVNTDYLIVSGVSNWGAYGLVGALSLLAGRDLLPSDVETRDNVLGILKEGGVDGVTLKAEPTVDGLPLERHYELLAQLREIVAAALR